MWINLNLKFDHRILNNLITSYCKIRNKNKRNTYTVESNTPPVKETSSGLSKENTFLLGNIPDAAKSYPTNI